LNNLFSYNIFSLTKHTLGNNKQQHQDIYI